MTARKHPPKLHGRSQQRTSKSKLLDLLQKNGPTTAAQLANMAGMTHKLARLHLEEMRSYGETYRLKNSYPAIWSNTPFSDDDVPPTYEDEDKIVQVIRPAGTWEVGHCVPTVAPSIFSMGAMA